MKVKIRLFDLYIITITFLKGIGLAADSKIYLLACVFGTAVVLVKIFMERFYPRELVGMITIMVIGGLNFVVAGGTSVLITAIALCGLKNVESERIIKISFWTRLAALGLMIFMSTTGIIENEVISFWRNGEFIDRSSFGYGHPNTAHIMYAVSVLLAIYLYGVKMRLVHYGLILLCNQWLFAYTGSRTGLVAVWISLACYFLMMEKKTRPLMMWFCRHAYILMGILTLALGLSYGRIGIVSTLDTLMTGRLQYINRVLLEEAITLFGKTEFQSILIDNGWVKLLYVGGLFAFLWFSYHIIAVENKLYSEDRSKELFLVTCFLIYNMAESFIDAFSINFSLVCIGEILFPRKEDEWKKSQYSHPPAIDRSR